MWRKTTAIYQEVLLDSNMLRVHLSYNWMQMWNPAIVLRLKPPLGEKKVPLYFLKALISIKLLEFPQECLAVSFMTTSRTLRRVEYLKKRLISFLVQVIFKVIKLTVRLLYKLKWTVNLNVVKASLIALTIRDVKVPRTVKLLICRKSLWKKKASLPRDFFQIAVRR